MPSCHWVSPRRRYPIYPGPTHYRRQLLRLHRAAVRFQDSATTVVRGRGNAGQVLAIVGCQSRRPAPNVHRRCFVVPTRKPSDLLSMLLTTTAALGFKVSIKKGARSSQLTWVGVRLTLTEDHLMMGLPEAYTTELVTLLKSWEGRGMAPIRELHQAAGKASWLSGKLPRARWVVSIFYRVLHARLADIKTGAEDRRRSDRKDNKDKSALFHVKQLEQAQRWLTHFLSGDGDGQTHQEVQAGQGQIPDSSHHHRCVPRGARCRLAHQQQGHQGLQLSGHPRRRQGAGLRAGQFKLPRHSGDPGSGGGPQALGQRAEYVQPHAASPVGQPSSPGDDTENVHEGHPHTRVSKHDRGLPEPPQQTQGGGHAPGAARSTNPAAEGQDSWILTNARRRRPTAVGVRCSRRVRVVNIALGGSRTRTFDISPDNLKAKKCCSRLRSAATHVTCCHSHHPYNFTWVVL